MRRQVDTPTIQLMRVIGSPYVRFNNEFSIQNPEILYSHAKNNRIPLLYLKALNKFKDLGNLQVEHDRLVARFVKVEKAFHRVSSVLDESGISYGFFKSVRPYDEVTVDIDVLIFGSDYEEAIRVLSSADYARNRVGRGPLSTTLRDREARISVDVYEEVGVSHIVYLDKDVLMDFVGDRSLSDGFVVQSLSPEADLLALIAHSIIKEHMYVLSEYYTTLYYLENMSYESLQSFASLADKCKIALAVKTHLGLSALLHYAAHCNVPKNLIILLKMLDVNKLELLGISKNGFDVPYKYPPATIIRALIEKLGEGKAKRSYAKQLTNMVNMKFISSFIMLTLNHILRESY